mgnify:CR=1 FL=1
MSIDHILTGPEVSIVAGAKKIFTKLFSVCSERSFSYSNSDRVDGLGMERRSGDEGEEEAAPDFVQLVTMQW